MFQKVRAALFVAVAAAMSPGVIHAQATQPARVAIINAQKAVAETAEIKRDQATLQAKYKPREQAIQDLQNQLQTIQQQLGTPNLASDREAQLRADGTDKQKRLQRLTEDFQSDFNAERQQILTQAGRQMTDIVKKLAEARNIDVVIDVTNTIYFKPALDITADATSAYDKAYPAK